MEAESTSAKPFEGSGASKPVDILTTQASVFYANLQPVLLLSTIFLSFKTLVKDPVSTLTGLAPPLALVQAIYCVVCLPSSGQAPTQAHKPGQKRKAQKAGQHLWAKITPAFVSTVLTTTLSAPVLYIVVVLFGAPLVSHHPHTFLLALHLALLTTPQLYYVHGLDPTTWLQIASLQVPIDETYGMSLGACVGAWLGAIPIPLDWDRDWQRWPVTVVTGLYIGAVVGKIAGGYVFKGWKIKLS
ncbi:hypothetical protein BAUCODRAFT_387348 [Baudoinia panamericana UAMH 10762]|uniref:Glycosylphosphatidylinositol anchor biosynthesis protein 11 n=1 Tax=Baudoinia panamericana (strain UAMH 10762) TaxID=717646 RepID=M2LWH7_BAUPA|nr:uncharacterized protein BAUCODRAFT_387348 [Baudoinia panamericana UAMH 10762]EMC98997.1 hypothetical protein BAUCODRAFT_387348 [Baudoinia panamericana UAMH 10762]